MSSEQLITDERPRSVSTAPELAVRHVPAVPSVAELPLRLAGTRRGGWTCAAYALTDTVAVAICLALAGLGCWLTGAAVSRDVAARFAAILAAAQLVVHAAAGMWNARVDSPVAEFRRLTLITLGIASSLAGFSLVTGAASLPLLVGLGAVACLLVVALPSMRSVLRQMCGRSNWWGRRILIVGGTAQAAKLQAVLERNPAGGLRPVGLLADQGRLAAEIDPAAYLGPPEFLGRLSSELGIDTALLVLSAHEADAAALVSQPATGIRHWLIAPEQTGLPGLWATAGEVGNSAVLQYSNGLLAREARWCKRAFDLTMIVVLSGLVAPLMCLIAALIRLSSAGPVFYSDERIGRHGRRFQAWKFRTMHQDAERLLQLHLEGDPALAAEWRAHYKLRDDPRIHWMGKVLRRSSLDELPQIWNVLRGEMSLVGPRPMLVEEIEKYGEDYQHYIKVAPGITGLWQVSGRNNTTYEERIGYVVYYVKNWSLWMDLYILACTARAVLFGEGAY